MKRNSFTFPFASSCIAAARPFTVAAIPESMLGLGWPLRLGTSSIPCPRLWPRLSLLLFLLELGYLFFVHQQRKFKYETLELSIENNQQALPHTSRYVGLSSPILHDGTLRNDNFAHKTV